MEAQPPIEAENGVVPHDPEMIQDDYHENAVNLSDVSAIAGEDDENVTNSS